MIGATFPEHGRGFVLSCGLARWMAIWVVAGLDLGGVCAASGALMQGGGATQFPAFSGAHVYVVDVADPARFLGLEPTFRELSTGTNRAYYAVVVNSSGTGSMATRDYVDLLFENWTKGAAGRFEPSRSVLIVVAVKNRQVAVRAGVELQLRYGLRGETIQRELVDPTFIPLARAGRLPEGLGALVQAISTWLDRRESSLAGTREVERSRLEQVKRDADEAIKTSQRLYAEARTELEEKRVAGLGVAGVEGLVDHAGEVLPALVGRVEAEPRVVLGEAQRVQHELEQALGRLRGLAARQSEANAVLEQVEQQVHAVEDALDRARGEKLATGAAQQALQQQLAARDEARKAIGRDPERALAQAKAVEAELGGLLSRIGGLPEVHRRRLERNREVERLRRALEAELARAEKSGASVSAVRTRFNQALKPRLDFALANEPADEQQALDALLALEPALKGEIQQVRAAESRHKLLSRTLPMGLGGAIVGLLALMGGSFWFLSRKARGRADRRFRDYRGRATNLMDQLDALKERHKLLPVSDPDFQAPLEGATLERYASVQDGIKQLWNRWLEVMDRLEAAQRTLGRAAVFDVQKVREAERILEDQSPLEEIERVAVVVSAELDELGQAHELARKVKASIEDRLKELEHDLDGLEAVGLGVSAYRTEIDAIESIEGQARGLLTPDPLQARVQLEEGDRRAEALLVRVREVKGVYERYVEATAQLERVVGEASTTRASGLRLDEEGGNPDTHLEQARRARELALEALNQADSAAANAQVGEIVEATEAARELIARVRAAREYARAAVPERRGGVEQLARAVEQARAHEVELKRAFADSSWRDVSDVVQHVEAAVQSMPERIARAEEFGSQAMQRYLAARRELERVEQDQSRARERIALLEQRRAQLEGARAESLAAAEDLRHAQGALEELIRDHPKEVGPQARAAVEELRSVRLRIERSTQSERPDWPAVQQSLARARESVVIARERAEADIRAYDKLQADLARLRPRLDQVGELLRREDRDRPPSNLRYRAALQTLERVVREAGAGPADWAYLDGLVQEAGKELDRSEQLAREDIRLANQASTELENAMRALRRARAFSALGISADTRAAEERLRQARDAQSAQDYEHAVRLATEAEQTARRALGEAERDARYRQDQIESERRRRAAAEMARRTGHLPRPGGIPASEWVIAAGQMAEAILRGAGAGGGITIGQRTGGPGGDGFPGFPRTGGGSGASQSSWDGPGGGSGSSQSGW